jgi:hypothetical protein
MDEATAARFWAKVDRGGPLPENRPDLGPCWSKRGKLNGEGYARWGQQRAHRVAYELVRGPIPDGMTLDHLCRRRWCVNPWHVEPVPNEENIARGEWSPILNARKKQCSAGHDYDEANTYVYRGHRQCRKCRTARNRARPSRRIAPRS